MPRRFLYFARLFAVEPQRYRNLLSTVYRERCCTMVEIGTYDGIHAIQMIETASLFHPRDEVEYHGFDLFETLTDEDLKTEFSMRPPACTVVAERLKKTGARVRLFKGYTRDTLPQFVEETQAKGQRIDLVFIDGGHSIDTVAHDWNCVKRIMSEGTTVIFDDYYSNSEPQVRSIGCQSLIDSLDRNLYDVEFLKPEDHLRREWGVLKISMVRVRMAPARPPARQTSDNQKQISS